MSVLVSRASFFSSPSLSMMCFFTSREKTRHFLISAMARDPLWTHTCFAVGVSLSFLDVRPRPSKFSNANERNRRLGSASLNIFLLLLCFFLICRRSCSSHIFSFFFCSMPSDHGVRYWSSTSSLGGGGGGSRKLVPAAERVKETRGNKCGMKTK